uniref:Ribosome biogenesis protein NOP53 n=1 Tax=Cyprinus carpio TaxID=7962 RepID=A0A8C1T2H9_CYPCA
VTSPPTFSRLFCTIMAAAGRYNRMAASQPGFLPLKSNLDGSFSYFKRRKRVNKNKKKNWNKFHDFLFFVDTGETDGKDTQPQTTVKKGKNLKPLWMDLILQLDSHIPGPKNVLAFQQPSAKKQRRISEKAAKLAALGVLPASELGRAAAASGVSGKEHPVANNNPDRAFYGLWSAGTPEARPERLNEEPSFLPAIEVIAPGGSYNPDLFLFFFLLDLFREAYEVEVKKLKAETGGVTLAKVSKIKNVYCKYCIFFFRIFRRFQAPDLDVQLSNELASSLCSLKPEGSILKDIFKSLQRRNISEARERSECKRKYKLKYSEKRAFREIQ